MQHNCSNGAAGLVSLSHFGVPTAAHHISSQEISIHLNISKLLCSLTRNQHKELSIIFNQMQMQLCTIDQYSQSTANEASGGKAVQWHTKMPRSLTDFRNFYLRDKNVIIPNLPRPSVSVVADHAYISLMECVSDLLGHGFPIDDIKDGTPQHKVNQISECVAAKNIYNNMLNSPLGQHNALCLFIMEWSDAFEPTVSVKSNRGSCWIKTVTISPPPMQLHSISHTYPIAIGRDGDSHELVEAKFAAELQAFKSGRNVKFYHCGEKKDVLVYLELICSLQDQPERRKSNNIMLGGSKYTCQWGYAQDIAQVAKHIPSCFTCAQKLKHRSTIYSCKDCLNWDITVEQDLLQFNAPPHFPDDEIPASNKLRPQRITYDLLKNVIRTEETKLIAGIWDKRNVESFLKN